MKALCHACNDNLKGKGRNNTNIADIDPNVLNEK